MKRFTKAAILGIAAAAAIAAPLASASADSWGRRGWDDRRGWDGPRYHHRHRDRGDAVAAGVLGLAAGAIIGGALAQPAPRYVEPAPRYVEPEPYYDAPAPRAYYPSRPARVTYGGSFEPWSRSWYEYCADRYRSFNPQTGTFRGYDGRDHFCTAN